MSKKLLYIGNKLGHKGASPTSIDILGPLLGSEGFEVSYASSVRNRTIRFLDMMIRIFKMRNQVDYVLIDTYSTTNFWFAFAAGRVCHLLKLPYIPMLRGGRLPERFLKSPKSFRSLLQHAHMNVVPSLYLMNFFKKQSVGNLTHIPNSILLTDYTFKKRHNLQPRLLWVRAFAEIYNPMLALQIYKKLVIVYPQAQLCMVGPDKDGSLKKCINYAEKHQLSVVFTGKLTKKEWIKRSVNFDIFLNTTHFDNMPVSVIEAMALGLSIVSTAVGGIPFLIENKKDGLLVDDGDESAFLTSIDYLLSNPEKAKTMAQRARSKVEQFDWEDVKHQWKSLLH